MTSGEGPTAGTGGTAAGCAGRTTGCFGVVPVVDGVAGRSAGDRSGMAALIAVGGCAAAVGRGLNGRAAGTAGLAAGAGGAAGLGTAGAGTGWSTVGGPTGVGVSAGAAARGAGASRRMSAAALVSMSSTVSRSTSVYPFPARKSMANCKQSITERSPETIIWAMARRTCGVRTREGGVVVMSAAEDEPPPALMPVKPPPA